MSTFSKGVLTIGLGALLCGPALAEELTTTDTGEKCTVIEGKSAGKGLSSSVTAGGGSVSSSTTVNGVTTSTGTSGNDVTASTSAGSVTTGSGSTSSSISSSSGPEGTTTITRASDGTCIITKSKP